MHKKRKYGGVLGQMERDLRRQEKMNLAFIRSLPQSSGAYIKEFGREAKEFTVPEFIHEEKISKAEKEFRMR